MPVSAATICQSGVAYPTAIEIARQMNAGAGNTSVNQLVAVGIQPQAATELVRQIEANSFDAHKLAKFGFRPETAVQVKKVSGA